MNLVSNKFSLEIALVPSDGYDTLGCILVSGGSLSIFAYSQEIAIGEAVDIPNVSREKLTSKIVFLVRDYPSGPETIGFLRCARL